VRGAPFDPEGAIAAGTISPNIRAPWLPPTTSTRARPAWPGAQAITRAATAAHRVAGDHSAAP
jgi:hypothetical protein